MDTNLRLRGFCHAPPLWFVGFGGVELYTLCSVRMFPKPECFTLGTSGPPGNIAWARASASELAMHQYRLVAWRDCDSDLLAPSQRQELLLIRAAISPPEPRAGQKECKVTVQMIQEIKDMLSEPYLFDEEGRVLLSSQTDGKNCAQVPVIMSTALCLRPFPLRDYHSRSSLLAASCPCVRFLRSSRLRGGGLFNAAIRAPCILHNYDGMMIAHSFRVAWNGLPPVLWQHRPGKF